MRYLIAALIFANVAFFFLYPTIDYETVINSRMSPLPASAKQLVLLSERQLAEDQPTLARVDSEQLQAPKQRRCLTLGPFPDESVANSARRLLAEQQFEPRIRIGNIEEPAGYWVYLPPMPAEYARAIIVDLEENGMKDYYLGKDFLLSLGIFSDRSKASKRQRQVADMGYAPKLQRRYRRRQAYWMDVEETGRSLQAHPVWQQLLDEDLEIAAQTVSCE